MAFSNHDVRPDTPINNFATLNPLISTTVTLSEGNLKGVVGNAAAKTFGNFLLPTSGKWYWEVTYISGGADAEAGGGIGIAKSISSTTAHVGNDTYSYAYRQNGHKSNAGASTAYHTAYTNSTVTNPNVIQLLWDGNKKSITFGLDGTMAASEAYSELIGDFFPAFGDNSSSGSATFSVNFGQDPTFAGNLTPTKVYTDSNGQGRFFYEPPTGALALCSRNIDTPKNIPSTYIVDETNNNILTYNGNTEISTFSPYATDGYSLHSIASTGNSFGSVSDFKYLHDGTESYTVSGWVYRTNADTNQVIMDTATFTSQGVGFTIFLNTHKFEVNISRNHAGNHAAVLETNYIVPLNQWVHFAFVFDHDASSNNDKINFYVNGVADNNSKTWNGFNANSAGNSNTSLHIGTRSAANLGLTGYIADLAIIKNPSGNPDYSVPSDKILSSTSNLDFLLSANSNGFEDSSSSPKTAATVGAPSIEAWSPYTSINKQTGFELPSTTNGGSIKLDGSSGYISTSGDSVDFGAAGTPFTLEAWVYPTTATQGTYAGIVGSYSTASNNTGFDLTASYDGNQKYSLHVGSGTSNWHQFNSAPKPYQWQHVAVTKDTSGNIRLYLDGVKDSKVDVQQSGDIFSSNKQLRIGHFWGNQYYNGYITNVRLSDTVRYVELNGNFTPPAQKFVSDNNTLFLYQPFQPKSTVNSSVFNITDSYNKDETDKNLTYYGDTRVVDFSPYKGGSHGSFFSDGTGDYISIPSLNANIGTGDFTIEFWVYLNITTAGTFFNSTTGLLYQIRASDDASLLQTNLSGTTTNKVSGNIQTSNLNKWVHHAIVRSGTGTDEVKIYENGIQSGICTISESLSFSQCNLADTAGFMTDFRIVGSAVYTGAFTPPYNELTAITNTKLLLQPGKVENSDNGAAKDPDSFFKCVAYEGNATSVGTSGRDISVGFPPDLVWVKDRDGTYYHQLHDSVRGTTTGGVLYSNGTDIQDSTYRLDNFTGASNDGFSLGPSSTAINTESNKIIAWCWKAAGAPTSTDTSEVGSARRITVNGTEAHTSCEALANAAKSVGSNEIITPRAMSINQQAGFSIVKYIGNNTALTTTNPAYTAHSAINDETGMQGIPHGLGKYAKLVLIKSLDSALGWITFYSHPTDGLGHNNHLRLDTSADPEGNYWTGDNRQGISYIPDTNNVIYVGNNDRVSKQGDNFIMYVFTDIEGYSKFGSYTAVSGTDNVFIYLGFSPRLVIIKSYAGGDATFGSWYMADSARSQFNPSGGSNVLWANSNVAEGKRGNESTNIGSNDYLDVDFLSNGFKVRAGSNAGEIGKNSGDYIFAAFAELPSSFARGQ